MDTPITTIEQSASDHIGNTLEKGIRGEYDFSVGAVLSEAWKKIHGIKSVFWRALVLAFLVGLGFSLLLMGVAFGVGVIAGFANVSHEALAILEKGIGSVFSLASGFVVGPLSAGLVMLSVKHLIGLPKYARSILGYFHFWKRLWLQDFILAVIILLIQFFNAYDYIWIVIPLVLIYLYLSVSYIFFPLLVVEKKLTAWQALEASRKAIGHHWFKFFWLLIVMAFIILGSVLTLGILLVWTVPMMNNMRAILYREVFGIDKVSAGEIV